MCPRYNFPTIEENKYSFQCILLGILSPLKKKNMGILVMLLYICSLSLKIQVFLLGYYTYSLSDVTSLNTCKGREGPGVIEGRGNNR